MTETSWAELRQVGLATLDHAEAVRAATELLALGPGFGDPELAEWHLADFTAPIGPDTYLEILAPTTPDHSMTRWLGRAGGAAGWVMATQVPSLAGIEERAEEHGVRIAVQTQAMGRNIVQFHPLDVGVLLELDEFLPRGAWFWDDLETARAAHARRRRPGRAVPHPHPLRLREPVRCQIHRISPLCSACCVPARDRSCPSRSCRSSTN